MYVGKDVHFVNFADSPHEQTTSKRCRLEMMSTVSILQILHHLYQMLLLGLSVHMYA